MSRRLAPAPWLPMRRLSVPARWALLVIVSVLAGAGLQEIGLPGALMLGPLIAAVLVQTAGGAVNVPRGGLAAAQSVIGLLIARSITPAVISGFLQHWPPVIVTVGLSLAGGVGIGWALGRLRIIPGTTPVWGMLPGAATAMMIMAEAYGADARLVAFMQYLRVVLVAVVASIMALLLTHGGAPHLSTGYFPPTDLRSFSATVMLAFVGSLLGVVSRIPAGALLVPLALGAALSGSGWVKIELPPVLLIVSYALIGWTIGMRFSRDVLAAAARTFPQCLGATALLMLLCGLLSFMLVKLLHTDPLTAYLAASPGGIDAAAVIAASSKVDMPLVMVVQTARVVVVLAIGPRLAQWAAKSLTAISPIVSSEPLDFGDLD
jgi:uncharacterized protein